MSYGANVGRLSRAVLCRRRSTCARRPSQYKRACAGINRSGCVRKRADNPPRTENIRLSRCNRSGGGFCFPAKYRNPLVRELGGVDVNTIHSSVIMPNLYGVPYLCRTYILGAIFVPNIYRVPYLCRTYILGAIFVPNIYRVPYLCWT